MNQEIITKASKWTTAPFDAATQEAVQTMITNNDPELAEAFYTDLDFGTGGLRGIMGVGTNRVNQYTLGQATQGLANYLKKHVAGTPKVAIAHDCRHNSKAFAEIVAKVLIANNIEVYLYEALRPTPSLSFAVRHYNCDSGIVLTASHNPKEYNGYKVYWNDGGQLVPPHDQGVIAEVRNVAFDAISFDGDSSKIHWLGEETDAAFLKHVKAASLSTLGKDNLKVVFTNLHGTAGTLLPRALRESGFSEVYTVKAQDEPDGSFPTVASPNPEEGPALAMAVALAEEKNADIVIGTDPDADRVGIAVRNLQGKMVLLNGNQAASALVYYVLKTKKDNHTLPKNAFIAETIVTTDLIAAIAEGFQVNCYKCLTGFKWIAQIIREKEGEEHYLVGGEESYGYLVGDFVRDKDAITAGVMLAEVAAWAKANGSSFYALLLDIYKQFGYYLESLVSIKKEGMQGAAEIAEMMTNLRANPPKTLGGIAVHRVLDYKSSESRDLTTQGISTIDLPKSNVIQLELADGSKVTARPSGTEPKIKFYFSVKSTLETLQDFEAVTAENEAKIAAFKSDLGI